MRRRVVFTAILFALVLLTWTLVAFAQDDPAAPASTLANVVAVVTAVSVVAGTLGGLLKHFAAPGTGWSKAGVFLSSLGTDFATLIKLLGGGGASAATRTLGVLAFVGATLVLTGCISSAAVVPVTTANQSQVQTCQTTASVHNGVVIGDFALSAGTAGVASGAVLATDSNTKTVLSGVGIGLAGGLAIGTAVAELTASNFVNSNCSSVVGALPTSPAPAPPATAKPPTVSWATVERLLTATPAKAQ